MPKSAHTPSPKLTDGSVARHLINLTIPMFLGISSMIVAAMIDTIYVGWIGTLELASVSFAFPVVMSLSTVSIGLGIGASSIIARVVGEGDFQRVQLLCVHALLLVILITLGLMIFGIIFADQIFRLLGADTLMLPLSTSYINVWLLGLPLFSVQMVATNLMRAVGNAKTPGFIMMSGAALQILIAPVCIFGLPGYFDGMGFEGAAWGFVVSRLITLVFTYIALSKMQLLNISGFQPGKILKSWSEILHIGMPAILSNLIGPVSMAVIFAMLADYGHAVVAGFGVASRLEALLTMVLISLSASTGPFIGQNWGARNYPRIFLAQKLAYQFSFFWGVLIFMAVLVFGEWCLMAINDNADVVAAAHNYLSWVSASFGFLGLGMIAGTTFVALGKPMPVLLMSVFRMFVLYIPLALLAEAWFGYVGIFAAAAVSNVVMGFVAVPWVRHTLQGMIRRNSEEV